MSTTQTLPAPRPVTPSTPKASPPQPSPHTPSRVLADFYDPDRHTLRICDIHQLTIEQLADVITGEEIEEAARNIRRITEIRLDIAKAEAEVAAWFRLMDLAGNFPTNARDRETSRKAAAQILRELKKPHALGAEGLQPSDHATGDADVLDTVATLPLDRPAADASPANPQSPLTPSASLNPLLNPTPPSTQETPPCQPTPPAPPIPSASPPPTPPACAPSAPRPSVPIPGPSAPPPATIASSPKTSPAPRSPIPTTPSSPSKILTAAGSMTGVELMAACP